MHPKKKLLFVLSLVELSALDSQLVVQFSQNKTNFCTPFYNKNSFHVPCCIFVSKETICVYLSKNSFLLLFYLFFCASLIDSCPLCGRSDTDIGRGSSVASSRFISFLVISFHLFQGFLFLDCVMILCFSLFLVGDLLYPFFYLVSPLFVISSFFLTFLSSFFLTKKFFLFSLFFFDLPLF